MKTKSTTTAIAAAVCGCLSAGCGSYPAGSAQPQPKETTQQASSVCAPVRAAVVLDQTASASVNGVPRLNASDLESPLDLIGACGGELGFGLLRDRSNVPLERIALADPPPGRPTLEEVPGNPLEAAEAEDRNRATEAEWERRREVRESHWKNATREFLDRIEPSLKRTDEANATDVAGALLRIRLFLDEHPARWRGRKPRLWAVLLTDGVHTLNTPVAAELPDGAQLAVVNSAGKLGHLARFPRLLRFESLDAAFAHMRAVLLERNSISNGGN
jgi:hypothetical protein